MNNKLLKLDLALCLLPLLYFVKYRFAGFYDISIFFLAVMLMRMAVSFMLYERSKRAWITYVMFLVPSFFVLRILEYALSHRGGVILAAAGMKDSNVFNNSVTLIMAAWLYFMPVVTYLTMLFRKKFAPASGRIGDAFGAILWRNRRAKYLMALTAIGCLATMSGYNMISNMRSVLCLTAPALSLWLICRYYNIATRRLWLVILGSAMFYMAQKTGGAIRVSLLVTSFALSAYAVYATLKSTRRVTFGVLLLVYVAAFLPTLSIGYNQYTCLKYRYQYNYLHFGWPGIMCISTDDSPWNEDLQAKYGLRDRYGLLVEPVYDDVYIDNADGYDGKATLRQNGMEKTFDLYTHEITNRDKFDESLQISLFEQMNNELKHSGITNVLRYEVAVTEMLTGNEVAHVKAKGYTDFFHEYGEGSYLLQEADTLQTGQFAVHRTPKDSFDDNNVTECATKVYKDSTLLYSVRLAVSSSSAVPGDSVASLTQRMGDAVLRHRPGIKPSSPAGE